MSLPGTVSEILSRKRPDVWSVGPDITVFEAVQLMGEKNVGALPVMENGRLVGVISERDYARQIVLKGRTSRGTIVRDILMHDPIVAGPSDTVVDCMRKMTERKVRHLPVMEGDEIIGIVSIGDLVNWIISAQAATIDHLHRYITGEYPA